MKTKNLRLMSIVLVVILVLSLAACGSGTIADIYGIGKDKDTPAEDIDPAELMAIPPIYDAAMDFTEGLAAVCLDGKWGFIDKTGEEVIPPIYEFVYYFTEGLAMAKLDGKCGYIDKTGAEVLPFVYSAAAPFFDGVAMVRMQEAEASGPLLQFIDKTGTIFTPEYYSATNFTEGLSVVQHGMMNFVVIDTAGNELIYLSHDLPNRTAEPFYDGLALVHKGLDYEGFMDKTGNMVITFDDPNSIDWANDFHDGLALIEYKDDTNVYIDTTGKEVISISDASFMNFSEGLAQATIYENGYQDGYIDKTGTLVIDQIYDWGHDFHEGFAAVVLDSKLGFINTEGEEVVPLVFDFINWMEDYSIDELDELEGTEKEIVLHDFLVSEGMSAVMVGDKWGFIDMAAFAE